MYMFCHTRQKSQKKRKKKKNLSGDLFLKAQKCTFHPKFFTKNIGIVKNCEDNQVTLSPLIIYKVDPLLYINSKIVKSNMKIVKSNMKSFKIPNINKPQRPKVHELQACLAQTCFTNLIKQLLRKQINCIRTRKPDERLHYLQFSVSLTTYNTSAFVYVAFL